MKYTIVPVTDFEQNCTILMCPDTAAAVIVDPGGEPERIIDALARLDASPVNILLTHGHIDHVGAAPELARRLRLPIIGPYREDAFLFEALPMQAQMFGFPPRPPFTPDAWLEPGDVIIVGEQRLEVHCCPGHTPGHAIFFHRPSRLAQVGDLLFRRSIGRTDLPRGDHAALLRSIRDVLMPLGDAVRFIPGHGPMSTLGEERGANPFLRGIF